MEHPVMLERDEELAALSAAVAAAAVGHGALVLVEGPAGIGKTTLLRAACQGDLRILTARGLALEQGFPYGIVRQLLDPVRREEGLLDGAAGLAARVFDWTEAGPVEDDVRYATMHGLYWLVANLAARQPLVLAVDDAHWADAPSLRWLAHLAARIEALPVALLLAAREGPDEPPLLDELRAAATRLPPAENRRRAGSTRCCSGRPAARCRSPCTARPMRSRTCSRPPRAGRPWARRTRRSRPGVPPRSPRTARSASTTRPPRWPPSSSSNRQIAEHLFITQATVETHLRHAFRKLGITSRADLTGRLST